jgi:hypothetical protein
MLPPYIIEQIRRREEEHQRQHYEQPQVEIPLPSNMPRPAAPEQAEDEEHGVVIIDL